MKDFFDSLNVVVDCVKNSPLCDIVKPKIGSVVKTNLEYGVEHSGIYVGKNKIIELNGDGDIREVSYDYFMRGDSDSFRCGQYIYVACYQDDNGTCLPLASPDIAKRARKSLGRTRDYNLFLENCHKFTEYCINGKVTDQIGFIISIELALTEKFKHKNHLMDMWRSTGINR